MPRGLTEKSINNKYARTQNKRASLYNESLKTREGTASQLGVSFETLKNIELGLCKFVPCDVVVRMADLYNAPELLNDYCLTECPIGRITGQNLELKPMERLALQLIRDTNDVDVVRDKLASITADGIIDESETNRAEADS